MCIRAEYIMPDILKQPGGVIVVHFGLDEPIARPHIEGERAFADAVPCDGELGTAGRGNNLWQGLAREDHGPSLCKPGVHGYGLFGHSV